MSYSGNELRRLMVKLWKTRGCPQDMWASVPSATLLSHRGVRPATRSSTTVVPSITDFQSEIPSPQQRQAAITASPGVRHEIYIVNRRQLLYWTGLASSWPLCNTIRSIHYQDLLAGQKCFGHLTDMSVTLGPGTETLSCTGMGTICNMVCINRDLKIERRS